ncbi:MAG: HEAT repeat domain-containing protein, partial [Planctomycetota bacterium]
MPFLSFLLLLAAPAVPQDEPLVRGAYHGPFDEALDESVFRGKNGRRSGSRETWERWEFWFEFEREALFRGPGRPDDLVLGKDGRYGSGPEALGRPAVLEQAVPLLVVALRSPHAAVREAASLALGRVAAPGSPQALQAMLQDPSAPVRQAALLGLGLSGMGKALVPLAEVFSNRAQSAGERALAALGLGLSGRKEAGELLEQYLRANLKPDRLFGEEETVLLGAVWACGRLGEARLVPVLLQGFQDLERNAATASRRTRTVILAALGQM